MMIFTSLIIGIVIVIALIVLLWKRKANDHEVGEINYRLFFIMGIVLMPMGLSWMVVALFTELYITPGLPFLAVGLAYIAIGLGHRDKWNKQ